jgi:predicted transcriptional regulator
MKYIHGFNKKYSVTRSGRVFSHKNNKLLKNCISKGYNTVTLYKRGVGKNYRVCRLVAKAFIPNPKKLKQVNHKNGIKSDDDVTNLEWCTASKNMKHAYQTGLKENNKGSKSVLSKLTEKDVIRIRYLYDNKITMPTELSKIFKVSLRHVWRIIKRERWVHI